MFLLFFYNTVKMCKFVFANNGNYEQLEAERRAKAEAEAKAAREQKAKEEAEAEIEKERKEKEAAERKAHQERAAREEAERKAAEAKAQAEEEARRAQEQQKQNVTKIISRDYQIQIQKTQQDFAKLKRYFQPIVESGYINPEEIQPMQEMLKNHLLRLHQVVSFHELCLLLRACCWTKTPLAL